MTTAPNLPVELHAEILQSLHQYRDRGTLLSAALVNKDWCTESQRILFSAVTDHWHDKPERRDSVVSTHIRFLQTIAEYPHSLGPLVRSYVQHFMACNPAAVRMRGLPRSSFDLWALTMRALPAMVNLKYLYFNPVDDDLPPNDNWVSSSQSLKKLTFQLATLSWRSYFHPKNGFSEFVATQQNLVHLDTGRDPCWLDLSWLPDGVCPHLVSISGDFKSFIHVSQSRKIVAWKWRPDLKWDEKLDPQTLEVLDGLKYLSLYNYRSFRDIVGPIDLNIDLLELIGNTWDSDLLASLSNLPRLRALILIQGSFPKLTNEDMVRIAGDCFKRLPSLHYVILDYSHFNGKDYLYLKLSRMPGSIADVCQVEVDIQYDVGPLWWTIYDI